VTALYVPPSSGKKCNPKKARSDIRIRQQIAIFELTNSHETESLLRQKPHPSMAEQIRKDAKKILHTINLTVTSQD